MATPLMTWGVEDVVRARFCLPTPRPRPLFRMVFNEGVVICSWRNKEGILSADWANSVWL